MGRSSKNRAKLILTSWPLAGGRNSRQTCAKRYSTRRRNQAVRLDSAAPTGPKRNARSGLREPLFRSAVDKAGDIRFQLGEVFVAQIHHVTRVVVLQVNIPLQLFRQAEMLHG